MRQFRFPFETSFRTASNLAQVRSWRPLGPILHTFTPPTDWGGPGAAGPPRVVVLHLQSPLSRDDESLRWSTVLYFGARAAGLAAACYTRRNLEIVVGESVRRCGSAALTKQYWRRKHWASHRLQ